MSGTAEKVSVPEGWYRHFILMLMTGVYVVNYLDRQIVGIMLPEIKAEFALSDTQLGLLHGLAFAIVYSVLGVPIGWLADRVNRRNLIAGCLALFSAATYACGLVANYWQLLIARFFTGVGEAGTGPAINSLISDYYRPSERARALSFYAAGLNIGLLVAYFGGGWMVQNWGWRTAIMVAGVPGLLLTVLLFLFVPEPPRGHRDGGAKAAPPFLSVVKYLLTQRSFMRLTLGSAMLTFNGSVVLAFVPAFLDRSHGMDPIERGISLALMSGVGGALGTYGAGILAGRLGRTNIRWNMYLLSIITLLQLPVLPIAYLSNDIALATTALAIPFILLAAYSGITLATVANLIPIGMRAQSLSIHTLMTGLFGVSFGPIATGMLSDALQPAFGQDALRWAILILCFASMLLAVLAYWWTSRDLAEDVETNQRN